MLTSFCMRAAGTIPVPGVGGLVSRLLLNMGHGSMGMLSSTVKPSKELSKVLLLQPLLLTRPAALSHGFVTALWVCAENRVTEKIQGKAENQQKILIFLTQIISVTLHSGRDGEGWGGGRGCSSYTEPDGEPRAGILMPS